VSQRSLGGLLLVKAALAFAPFAILGAAIDWVDAAVERVVPVAPRGAVVRASRARRPVVAARIGVDPHAVR
jgi:hypothetical protein